MNIKMIGLLAAASLATVACSQEKKVETTTTTTVPADANTAVVLPDTMLARDEARRLAARVAEDLKLTDTVVVTRIEKTYYTRGRRLGEYQTRYATDTTGRYLAVRQANDQADEEVRTTLNNPAYYNTYSANRASYGDGPYSLVPARVAPVRTGSASVGQGFNLALEIAASVLVLGALMFVALARAYPYPLPRAYPLARAVR